MDRGATDTGSVLTGSRNGKKGSFKDPCRLRSTGFDLRGGRGKRKLCKRGGREKTLTVSVVDDVLDFRHTERN